MLGLDRIGADHEEILLPVVLERVDFGELNLTFIRSGRTHGPG